MRQALTGLKRFITSNRYGKRLLFCWTDAWTCPSDLTTLFAFDDDYSMGVLSSHAHGAWATSRGSTLEDRRRYTSSSVFEKFPWPYPVPDEQRERIAAASRAVITRRQQICEGQNFGLTELYNRVDEGAYTDLSKMHRDLDEAVAAAYGWPKAVAQDDDEIIRRLFALNAEIRAGKRVYEPFGDPGRPVPPEYCGVSADRQPVPIYRQAGGRRSFLGCVSPALLRGHNYSVG